MMIIIIAENTKMDGQIFGWPDFSTPCQNYKAPKPEIEAKNPEIEAKKDNCDPIIYDSIESLEL